MLVVESPIKSPFYWVNSCCLNLFVAEFLDFDRSFSGNSSNLSVAEANSLSQVRHVKSLISLQWSLLSYRIGMRSSFFKSNRLPEFGILKMNIDGRKYFSSAKDNHFAFNPAKPVGKSSRLNGKPPPTNRLRHVAVRVFGCSSVLFWGVRSQARFGSLPLVCLESDG